MPSGDAPGKPGTSTKHYVSLALALVGCFLVGASIGSPSVDTSTPPPPSSGVGTGQGPPHGGGGHVGGGAGDSLGAVPTRDGGSDGDTGGGDELPPAGTPAPAATDLDVLPPWWNSSQVQGSIAQYSPYNITVQKAMPPDSLVKTFFKNIVAVIMMSPGRYHLVDTVKRHYAPYFTHFYFCGPHNDTNFSVPIHGYDIVWGNEQYRAVSRIIRKLERNPPTPDLEGYFYLSDDVMIQPWALVTFDKRKIWGTLMGIANTKSGGQVLAVPGMSVEGKFRREWPYWKKNRGKLQRALSDGGPEMRAMLRENAKRMHPMTLKWSKYDRRLMSDEAMEWAVYFTIVDTYYVPRRFAPKYADYCDIMERNWVFGECAIATALRALDWDIQTLHIQFYWSTLNAADCPRARWGASFSGFHRCRHDHPFTEKIFNTTTRHRLMHDAKYRAAMLSGGQSIGAEPAE